MRKTTPLFILAPLLALGSLYPLGHVSSLLITGILLAATSCLYLTINPHKLTLSFLVPSVRGSFSTPWPLCILIATLSLAATVNHQPIPTFLPTAWNQLIRPLCHVGLLHLLTPLALAFTAWTMRTTGHPWLQINRFALCLFTCLLMWPDSAADLPPLGLLIMSLLLLITRPRLSLPELMACILLLTIAATARSIFIFLPLLFGFSLLAVWPKRAIQVTLGSFALLWLLKPIFPTFPAMEYTSPTTLAAIALLTTIIIQSAYHWRWWPAHQHAAWGLGTPLFIIALSNLAETSSFSLWYGAIYLTPALPVITYTLLRPTFKNN